MAGKKTFISFDFDHDEDLKNLLVGQSKLPDSPFEISDNSVKEPMTGDWKQKVRRRIKNCELVIIMCGEYTHTASGVAAELLITQEEKTPYFLLHGRNGKNCTKPTTAKPTDKIYQWTWENLKKLISGAR